jgi:hypothetical protein
VFPQSFRRIFLFPKKILFEGHPPGLPRSKGDGGCMRDPLVTTYPECVYCGKRYRYERFNVECHMDPNIGKTTTTPFLSKKTGRKQCLFSFFFEKKELPPKKIRK